MAHVRPGVSKVRDLNPRKLDQFPPGQRYLIGVSGGRDSVALLHCLARRGYDELVICHLNHELRGQSSRADARFVQELADRYDFETETASISVRALGAKGKMSIETAAREARYAFFAATARRRQCDTIFLGHHADDLVETFIFNLFRGAGRAGLTGMREVSKRRIESTDLVIVRPLLGVWRAEIDKYIRSHRLKFREDASNRSLLPMRNRVRRRVIPYLEKNLGPRVRHNIWKAAMIFAEEENFFDTLLPDSLASVAALAVEPLRKMSIAVQRRMLQQWLHASDVRDIGFDVIERVRALLDTTGGVAKTNLPRDRHVRRRAGKLFME